MYRVMRVYFAKNYRKMQIVKNLDFLSFSVTPGNYGFSSNFDIGLWLECK